MSPFLCNSRLFVQRYFVTISFGQFFLIKLSEVTKIRFNSKQKRSKIEKINYELI